MQFNERVELVKNNPMDVNNPVHMALYAECLEYAVNSTIAELNSGIRSMVTVEQLENLATLNARQAGVVAQDVIHRVLDKHPGPLPETRGGILPHAMHAPELEMARWNTARSLV